MYAAVALEADALTDADQYRRDVARRGLVERFRRVDPNTFDLILTVGAVLLCVGSQLGGTEPAFKEPDALSILLGFAVAIPLYWRRRRPLAALLCSTTAITVLGMLEYRPDPAPLVVLFILYAVGAYEPLRRSLFGLLVVNAAVVVIWLSDIPDFDLAGMAFNLALFTATWLGGLAMRSRATASAARLAEAEERAEVERQQAARSVAEERLRIAQELHDVVAHSMSVIAVQAGMGVHVIDDQPDAAKQALESISRTSRSTLQEMRRLLGVLRGEDGERAHVPAPGLGDLPTLVEQVRATGLPVELTVDGQRAEVPLGVDLSAYRVVQEGLTNVIKHAGMASAAVHVRYQPGEIVVEVSDDGRGAATPARENGGGHGLVGMRERVAVWGGTLDAGPVPGGGYRVLAHLPYAEPT
jgi:signal transduction histidine kinase